MVWIIISLVILILFIGLCVWIVAEDEPPRDKKLNPDVERRIRDDKT